MSAPSGWDRHCAAQPPRTAHLRERPVQPDLSGESAVRSIRWRWGGFEREPASEILAR